MHSATLALLVQHVLPAGGPQGPPAGDEPMALSASLYVAVAAAGLAVAPTLTRVPASRVVRAVRTSLAVTYAALTLVVLATAGPAAVLAVFAAQSADRVAVIALHLVGVTVWVGGVMHLALSALTQGPRRLAAAVVTFAPYALVASAAVAGSGVVLAIGDRVNMHTLFTTTLGALVTLKACALCLAALLGFGHRVIRVARERVLFLRGEAAVLAVTLGVGSALLAVPAPLLAVTAIAPGVSTVALGADGAASVFVNATPAGARLLLLSDESLLVVDGGRRVQLAPGQSMPVTLHQGRAVVALTSGDVTRVARVVPAHVPSPSSTLLPDPDARLAFALGRVVARARAGDAGRSRTSWCTPDDGALAAATRQLLRGRGEAGRIVVSGDSGSAIRQLARIAASGRGSAIYLAPQLLDGAVLAEVARLRLPPVTVVGVGDPMSPAADRYRAELALLGGGARPTGAGLLGFESVTAPRSAGVVRLYAAEPVGFLPGVLDRGHAHGDDPWIPGGAIVATTAALHVPFTCDPPEAS